MIMMAVQAEQWKRSLVGGQTLTEASHASIADMDGGQLK